jgi:hypothetical protein
MVGAYHKACPTQIPLKKGWEGVNVFLVLIVHLVTFKGEDYIMNYIEA